MRTDQNPICLEGGDTKTIPAWKEDRPKPYLLGTAKDEDRVSLVKGGLSKQSTGLGIFEIPAGAAVNPVYHLALGVHQLVADQQPLVQLNWPVSSSMQGFALYDIGDGI